MTTLFKVTGNDLVPVPRGRIGSEEMLETWISNDPRIIGLDVLVIGRQIVTDFNGRIDILAMDREGDLTVIELKRDRTPRDVIAQILDYASWVASLTTRQVHEHAMAKLGRPLEEAFRERFDAELPETLNGNHTMVVVASELDASSKRIVEYLAEVHGVGINTAFFRTFEDEGQQFLATDWLMDQQEVRERSESKKRPPWSGLWYANVGEGPHRSWEDMRKYGFLAAGGGRVYSGRLDNLSPGDEVYAYQKGAGYVGYGTVVAQAAMARDVEIDGQPLLKLPLVQPQLAHRVDDPELAEHVVRVDWHKTFPISEAKTFTGAFANQNVVCKLRDPATIEFLRRVFGEADGNDVKHDPSRNPIPIKALA
jgi:hypothetical protein